VSIYTRYFVIVLHQDKVKVLGLRKSRDEGNIFTKGSVNKNLKK